MKTSLPLLALGATLAALLLAGCQTTQPLPELNPDGGPDGGNGALRLDTTQLENGIPEVPYLERLQASGGAPPYRFEIQRPKVLEWVSVQGSALTGTPREIGAGTLSISVHDALDAGVSASLPLAVVGCQDGAQYPCELADAGVCQLGIAACNGGELGACGALNQSNSVFACGPDCGACDSARADHCQDGGTCACGTTGTLCADGTTCCPGADCVEVAVDPTNCKSCGNDCTQRTPPHMDAGCGALDCEFTCIAPFDDCDAQLGNGCETDLTDTTGSCGECGNDCMALLGANATQADCASSSCRVSACNTGFGDCDHMFPNGCEVNTTNSTANCGACGNNCDLQLGTHASAASCAGSTCHVSSCSTTDYSDCDGSFANGCEINTSNSTANCGACGYNCNEHLGSRAASAYCGSSTCHVSLCQSTYRDCDADFANGCEVDVYSDPNNCNTCGTVCLGPTSGPDSGTAVCNDGTCGIQCASGLTRCGSECVDLTLDKRNCGTCGHICSGAALCDQGGCCLPTAPGCGV